MKKLLCPQCGTHHNAFPKPKDCTNCGPLNFVPRKTFRQILDEALEAEREQENENLPNVHVIGKKAS